MNKRPRHSKRQSHLNRRTLLKAAAASTAGVVVGGSSCWKARNAHAQEGNGPYFLIVIGAFGGGAIIDSFLPVAESEAQSPNAVDCFPDADIWSDAASPIRIADASFSSIGTFNLGQTVNLPLSPIASKHISETMVTTVQHTSVNHAVAQHRSLTGGGAWSGRTLQESVALAYGDGFAIPNVNMASMGFLQPGDDPSLPSSAYPEAVASPLLKPLSLSANKGIVGVPNSELLNVARDMRNKQLDPETSFYQTFRNSERLKRWKRQREVDAPVLEADALIDKLIFVEDSEAIPLSKFGLQASPDAAQLAQLFPDIIGGALDPFHHQAALAFLLLKYGVSVAVTISPDFVLRFSQNHPLGVTQPTLGFDGAHGDHRSSQALGWWRVLDVADKLIGLLKEEMYDDSTGETMWDRTMIHFAPDFGRSKLRANTTTWGSSHSLNNGTATISPLVNGNTVLGGVTKGVGVNEDCHTYGFDLQTGAEDPSRQTSEAEHHAGLLQALHIDTSPASLPDVPSMRKQS